MLSRVKLLNDWIRCVLIFISSIVTAFTLNRYALLIPHLLHIRYNFWFELAMIAGMIAFQYPLLNKQSASVKLDYCFRMMLVSLMGSALLWPLLLINHFFACGDIFNIIYFLCVVIIMFFTHKKIVQSMKLPALLSYTWIAYRVVILLFIL